MAVLPTLVGASPLNADDANRLLFTVDTDLEVLTRALTDTPALFQSMDTLTWTVQWRCNLTGDDSIGLEMRVMNGATVLAAASSGGGWVTVKTTTATGGTTDVSVGPTSFAYVNTGASKAQWDGASVELRQRYSRNMGGDGRRIEVDITSFDGTYTVANAPPNTPVITAPTDGATVLGPSVELSATVIDPDGDAVRARWEVWSSGTPGATLDSFPGPAGQVRGVAHDGTSLWVVSDSTSTIYKINPATGAVLDSIPTPGTLGGTRDISWDEDLGLLWVVEPNDFAIYGINPANGAINLTHSAPALDCSGIAYNGANVLYITTNIGLIYLITTDTGTSLGSFSFPLDDTAGAAFDGTFLYVVDPVFDQIVQLTTGFDVVTSVLSPDTLPWGLDVSPDGTLWHSGNGSLPSIVFHLTGFPSLVQDVPQNTTPVTSGSTHTTSWDSTTVPDGDYSLHAYGIDSPGGAESSSFDSHAITVEQTPAALAFPDVLVAGTLRPGTDAKVLVSGTLRPVTRLRMWDGTALRPVTG